VDHFRLIAGEKKDCQEVKVVREKNGWQPLAAARQQPLQKKIDCRRSSSCTESRGPDDDSYPRQIVIDGTGGPQIDGCCQHRLGLRVSTPDG
jgi:hypothetical protein